MKFKFVKTALISTALIVSSFAHSTIITHGDLTSDDTTDIIYNTVTGVEYLRFDTFQLSYADTVAAVGNGGAYEGWSIADSLASDAFLSGLLGGNSLCDGAVDYGTVCGTVVDWSDGDFGQSGNPGWDYYSFISTLSTPDRTAQHIGLFSIRDNGVVYDYDDWTNSTSGTSNGINLLLFRSTIAPNAVPEPSTLAIFALGIIGLASRRFKEHS